MASKSLTLTFTFTNLAATAVRCTGSPPLSPLLLQRAIPWKTPPPPTLPTVATRASSVPPSNPSPCHPDPSHLPPPSPPPSTPLQTLHAFRLGRDYVPSADTPVSQLLTGCDGVRWAKIPGARFPDDWMQLGCVVDWHGFTCAALFLSDVLSVRFWRLFVLVPGSCGPYSIFSVQHHSNRTSHDGRHMHAVYGNVMHRS